MRAIWLPILLSMLLLVPVVIVSYCNVLNYVTTINCIDTGKDETPSGKNTPTNQNIAEEEEEHIYVVDDLTPLYVAAFTSVRNIVFNKKPLVVFLDVKTQPPLDFS
ncbi:MAG: hypothetical protein H6588_06100 [Flavobacteriales bacterium]|nr:hypothetical protein [Flavobacteriales bacterium]